MAENNIKLIIYPSAAGSDTLTVVDAMQQVLDYFTLLSKAEARKPGSQVKVVWRLESATANSPFTIEASAGSSDPEVSIERQAMNARLTFQEGLGRIFRGEAKPIWLDQDAEAVMRRILARNLNGIARTDIVAVINAAPIILDNRTARRAQNFLDLKAAEAALQVEDLSRKESGSIEGQAAGLTTHYRKPALEIRERLSGRVVKCVLPEVIAESIGSQFQWNEVWSNRRIVVSGLCHYDKAGMLLLIEAQEISRIATRDVPLSEIRDSTFSDGLTPQQHLDKLWGPPNG